MGIIKKESNLKNNLMIKKALIVGINHYYNDTESMNGCIKDAEDLAGLLGTNYSEHNKKGEPNFLCEVITSNEDPDEPLITRTSLKTKIQSLFDDEEADAVLFYFSGHGFENSLGGYLVTQDAKFYEEGVSFNTIINHANKVQGKEIFIILDCCQSGNLGQITIAKNELTNIRSGVHIMTASNAQQLSWDTQNGGVFTQLICNALRGGSSDVFGNITFFHLYRHAEKMLGAWEQRPTLKTNLQKSIVLRKVEPIISISVISNITSYFPTPNSDFQLDPKFEPSENHGDIQKESQFLDLQKMANNGMVVPIGETHMYYAAIHSKKCKLTLLGQQYWQLVNTPQN
ncbi:MAG: putative caspase-like protein [Crocinitomix sp.]